MQKVFTKALACVYKTIWYHIPESSNLYTITYSQLCQPGSGMAWRPEDAVHILEVKCQ